MSHLLSSITHFPFSISSILPSESRIRWKIYLHIYLYQRRTKHFCLQTSKHPRDITPIWLIKRFLLCHSHGDTKFKIHSKWTFVLQDPLRKVNSLHLSVVIQQLSEDNMGKPNPLMKTLHEYSEVSTVHGIGYVFSRSVPKVDRLLWTILTVTRQGRPWKTPRAESISYL